MICEGNLNNDNYVEQYTKTILFKTKNIAKKTRALLLLGTKNILKSTPSVHKKRWRALIP
jgi:hypothetical protein